MTRDRPRLTRRPCRDSAEMADQRRRELQLPREMAAQLGRATVEATREGWYRAASGRAVDISEAVRRARASAVSLRPDDPLPEPPSGRYRQTVVEVANETTLAAGHRLAEAGLEPLVLNFANGVHPGGGFLGGARAQEEVLCRSSALYETLAGDPMYEAHSLRDRPDSTNWAIYSPDVPVIRRDGGEALEEPWALSFLTCAAPYAPAIGQPEAGDLLAARIRRVLEIAHAFEHPSLVLGAWGCGAFRNDPRRTARDFRAALEGDYAGAFSHVSFAVVDWSPERRFLQPFCEEFASPPSSPALERS